jgi:hypothetical protein
LQAEACPPLFQFFTLYFSRDTLPVLTQGYHSSTFFAAQRMEQIDIPDSVEEPLLLELLLSHVAHFSGTHRKRHSAQCK